MSRDTDPPTKKRGRERRCSARLPVVKLVWYKILEDEWDDSDSSIEGVSKMCDISHNGVGLVVTQNLPLGKHIFVEVTSYKFSVSAVGVVVYNKEQGKGFYRIGIRFKIMPPNDKLTLDGFIKNYDKG